MTARRYASGTAREDGRVMGIAPPTAGEAAACAMMITRHARTLEEGDMFAAMLGITVRTPAQALAERIRRLADSITVPVGGAE